MQGGKAESSLSAAISLNSFLGAQLSPQPPPLRLETRRHAPGQTCTARAHNADTTAWHHVLTRCITPSVCAPRYRPPFFLLRAGMR